MSRLDSFIRRLEAQRACLDEAARLIGDAPGIVLELGLGNGRTYDHLRHLLPARDIYAFDRAVAAHPDCIPDQSHLFIGDIFVTLGKAAERLKAQAILAHLDLGSGNKAETERQAKAIVPHLLPLLSKGAIILSDQPLLGEGLESIPLPHSVKPGRYFMYRWS